MVSQTFFFCPVTESTIGKINSQVISWKSAVFNINNIDSVPVQFFNIFFYRLGFWLGRKTNRQIKDSS